MKLKIIKKHRYYHKKFRRKIKTKLMENNKKIKVIIWKNYY